MDIKMYVECRLFGDDYDNHYVSGVSMADGTTTKNILKNIPGERDYLLAGERVSDGCDHDFTLNVRQVREAYRVSTTVQNNSGADTKIEMIANVALRHLEFTKVHRMRSFWSAEGHLVTDTKAELNLSPSWAGQGARIEKFCNLSSAPNKIYHPFICLENEETGEFLGFMLSGGYAWQIELIERDREFFLSGGQADYDTGRWRKNLKAGESYTTGETFIAVGHSIEEVCGKLTAAQEPSISPKDDHMAIAFNEYCVTWGNANEENLLRILETLKDKGIGLFVIDSGWYLEGGNWWDDQGNWNINKNNFPNGFKHVTAKAREYGMIPGLWYEIEVVGNHVAAYNETDHLLKRDGVPITVGGCRFWDMTDPWVIDYLTEKVIYALRDNDFGYIKIDYNSQIPVGCDGFESDGEGLRRQMQGVIAFYKRIREILPDMIIELCASGGHRLVPDFLEVSSQASFSDAHETKYIPVIAANCHRFMQPRQSQIWAVLRAKDDITRIQYSLCNTFLGRMCLSGDIYDLSETQWQVVDAGMAFYKEAAEIIEKGTTTLIQSDCKDVTVPVGCQLVVREYEGKKLLVFHRFENSVSIGAWLRMHEDRPQIAELAGLYKGTVLAHYGEADRDFSAESWIIR